MFRHAIRLQRGQTLGYGAAFALTALAVGATYAKVAGTTAASRAAFAHGVAELAAQFSYLMPQPHRLGTLAGYLLWKGWGALPIVAAIWAVLAASGAARGDENRHLVDAWLACGTPRRTLVATRLAAFGCASGVAAVARAAGSLLGAVGPGGGVPAAGLAAQTAAFWLFTWACFALCYLVAQLPGSASGAYAATGGVMLALYLLDVAGRSAAAMHPLAWMSPFRWYDATDALAPGGHVSVAGLSLCVALLIVAGVLAAIAFERRDVGAALWSRPQLRPRVPHRPPSPTGWLTLPVLRLLHRERGMVVVWLVVVGLVSVFFVAVAHAVASELTGAGSVLANAPGLQAFLNLGGRNPDLAFLSVFWTSVTQLLLAGLAAQLVAAWAADDTGGILAAMLTRPVSRTGILWERAGAATVALAAGAAVAAVAAALAAGAQGTSLPLGRLVAATLLFVPFGLTFAAVGAAAGGRWPRLAAAVLGAFAFASYFWTEVSPFTGWPTWIENLSVFRLYGAPMSGPPYWTGLWVMSTIIATGFAVAIWGIRRRDVA